MLMHIAEPNHYFNGLDVGIVIAVLVEVVDEPMDEAPWV
jgi:hypothetical protein